MAICPNCFNEIGVWSNDPIKIPGGCKHYIHPSTGLRTAVPLQTLNETELEKKTRENLTKYDGFTHILGQDIQDLIDRQQSLETELGLQSSEKTQFPTLTGDDKITLNTTKDIIQQLRWSVEQLLTKQGLTKAQFLNYDSNGIRRQIFDGNMEQSDWTDPDLTAYTGNIHYMHIEELRRNFPVAPPTYLFYESGGPVTYNNLGGEQLLGTMWRKWEWAEVGTLGTGIVRITSYKASEIGTADTGWPDQTGTNQLTGLAPSGGTWNGYTSFQEPPWQPGGNDGLYALGSIVDPGPHQYWALYNFCYGSGFTLNSTMYWYIWKYGASYANYNHTIMAIPQPLDKTTSNYSVKEITCAPILVDETVGYPAYTVVGSSAIYAQPKIKSVGWLEDAILIDSTASYPLTVYEGDAFDIYPSEYLTSHPKFYTFTGTCAAQSGPTTTEETFEERNIDSTSWGLSSPEGSLISGEGYLRGVSTPSTQSTGSCSIYIPTSWNSTNLSKNIRQYTLTHILTQDDLNWCIDISGHNVDSIFSAKTDQFKPMKIRDNCIFTKEDGITVATGFETGSSSLSSGATSFSIASDSIDHLVNVWIGDITGTNKCTYVSSFSGYTSSDAVFTVSGTTVTFISGFITSNVIAYWEAYTNEVAITKYYPEGYIVLSSPMSWWDQTHNYWYHNESGLAPAPEIKIILRYYNAPHHYGEITSPITQYWVTPLDMPSTSGMVPN